MFSQKDIDQFKTLGISEENVKSQLDNFKQGFPYLEIVKPATIDDGIIELEISEVEDLAYVYNSYDGTRQKFVPASGAATRMFKNLFELIDCLFDDNNNCFEDKSFDSAWNFFQNLKNFAFFEDLSQELNKQGYDIGKLIEEEEYKTILNILLKPEGMNYGSMPKALLKFHQYTEGSRTALEEHLVEGARYARMSNSKVDIHLTVSPEHRESFRKTLDEVIESYTQAHEVEFNISLSEQKKSTDMIAVDENNNPLREESGSLVFRPGGHGALLENLNDINADIVFIKNIDNVVPDRLKNTTVLYKKALAGLLISYQSLVFDYLLQLQSDEPCSNEFLEEVFDFTVSELCILPPSKLKVKDFAILRSYLISKLNRPIRVCGMVKNEGEPGGGPFWAKNPDGSISLQVVETSQINLKDSKKKTIINASTHFNPVDLVCGITNFDGQKFNLPDFRDPLTGFISNKTKDGKPIKAQELPGLWNGAMSNWITIFVEVPLVTFNPVKTANDLLREQHQA